MRRSLTCALLVLGLSATRAAMAQTYGVVHTFGYAGRPLGSLIQASDGAFYGTTSLGGPSGVGTIFRLDASGLTTLHNFAYADGAFPSAALVQASDGNLYGTAPLGGAKNHGALFRINAAGDFAILHGFDGNDGAEPLCTLIQATDGNLYGTTSGGYYDTGTVFRFNTAGTLTSLHDFSGGENVFAGLVQATDGDFYGTTRNGIYRVDGAGNYEELHHFMGTEGNDLNAGLIQATDGFLYGTAVGGGSQGHGLIFRTDTAGNVTELHSFFNVDPDGVQPEAPLIQASDGYFYGTNSLRGTYDGGTAFRMDSSGNITRLYSFGAPGEGANPFAGLVQGNDGAFYGTTIRGGSSDHGSVFRLTGVDELSTLHSFSAEGAGAGPTGLVQAADGYFYGTTYYGGLHDLGTIFRLDGLGKVIPLYSFSGQDGSFPMGRLVQASDGLLYGTTVGGGANSLGTVFRVDTSGVLTTIHSFDGTDGNAPASGLVRGADEFLYGTTSGMWNGSKGTIFRIDTSGELSTLHAFAGPEGSGSGALVQAYGFFYGATGDGGASGKGTIFKIDTAGTLTTLHEFNGTDGAQPGSRLTLASDGYLYGTTTSGGQFLYGTIFKMDRNGAFTTLASAGSPFYGLSGLVQGADGNFWGTASMGGFYGEGFVFEITSNAGLLWWHSMNMIDGLNPMDGLIEASDGSIYGLTGAGGPASQYSAGVIFRISPSDLAVNAILPTSGPSGGGSAISVAGGGFFETDTLTVSSDTAANLYVLDATFLWGLAPALTPGTLNDVTVSNGAASATLPKAYFADFLDVTQHDIFHDYVETILRAGITAGCGGGNFCRNDPVRRDQMAVFLLKAEHGSAYTPPPCADVFPDTPCPGPFTDWVEQLAGEQITGGCGGGNYCPASPVTREQMAVFLLKTEHGPSYVPPTCTGVFGDVACPSQFADWIERLYADSVTGGCSANPLLYCPLAPVTRGQMAVFLTKAFGVQ